MAKKKPNNVKRKEFEDFKEATIGLFEKQNKIFDALADTVKFITDKDKGLLKLLTDIDRSLIKIILKMFKTLIYLIFSFFLLSVFWDEVTGSLVKIFNFIRHLFSQTSPDTRWQTLIIVPTAILTAIITLIIKHYYDKSKKKK